MSETGGLPSVEEVARVIHRVTCGCEDSDGDNYLESARGVLALVEAAVPAIKAEALAPLRELHKSFTASIGTYCESCGSRYPCPTVRLLNAIESEAGEAMSETTGLPSVEEVARLIAGSLPESWCGTSPERMAEIVQPLFVAAVPRIQAETIAEYERYQTAEALEGWQ